MKKGIIILLIVVAILAGLAYFAKKKFDKAMKFCYVYNIPKSKINKVNQSEINIDFAIDFKNTADATISVDNYKFDILLNNKKVSEVVSTTPISIEANKFTTIIIPIRVLVKDLLTKNVIDQETIKNLLFDKSKVIITVKGTVSAGALGIKVNDFPLEISYSLKDMLAPSSEPTVECK